MSPCENGNTLKFFSAYISLRYIEHGLLCKVLLFWGLNEKWCLSSHSVVSSSSRLHLGSHETSGCTGFTFYFVTEVLPPAKKKSVNAISFCFPSLGRRWQIIEVVPKEVLCQWTIRWWASGYKWELINEFGYHMSSVPIHRK